MPRRLPGVTKYQTKDGRTLWQYVLDLGHDPATGKRRQSRKRGFTTQAEAAEALTETRRAVRKGTYVETTTLRLGEYLLGWVQTRATNGLRPSTVASYRQLITDYINPYLGEIELQALTVGALDNLYAELLDTGGKRGKVLSRRSVRYTHTVRRAALGDAERKGIIVRNVAQFADAPTAKSAKAAEPKSWTPEELSTFLKATYDHKHGPLFHVAALTGLRRGELCGLRWEDVDLDTAGLRVRQAVSTPDGVPVFGPPKTAKSKRTVSLDAGTVDRLKDQLARIADMQEAAGEQWTNSGLVFVGAAGLLIHPDNVSHDFAAAVKQIPEVSHLSIHGLRHTHATHLLAANINAKIVADRLGHHSAAFTLDTYTHVMPGQHAEAAAAAAALLGDEGLGAPDCVGEQAQD